MKVTRTIVTTQFQVYHLEVKDGIPYPFIVQDEKVIGTTEWSEEQVNKYVSKNYGKGYIACNITTFSELRGMSIETFYENSYVIKGGN